MISVVAGAGAAIGAGVVAVAVYVTSCLASAGILILACGIVPKGRLNCDGASISNNPFMATIFDRPAYWPVADQN